VVLNKHWFFSSKPRCHVFINNGCYNTCTCSNIFKSESVLAYVKLFSPSKRFALIIYKRKYICFNKITYFLSYSFIYMQLIKYKISILRHADDLLNIMHMYSYLYKGDK